MNPLAPKKNTTPRKAPAKAASKSAASVAATPATAAAIAPIPAPQKTSATAKAKAAAKSAQNVASNIVVRPPIVAIMGHIDHGKSTLLDYIRKTNTVDREAGGITQHVAAYEVIHKAKNADGVENVRRITFIDTPGHASFKGIRQRGANLADIGILIVSGEEGVKPQTLEAYQCIQASKVPYIVAITKMDSPKADVERVKQSLAENEIYVEGYGGDVPWVAISAKSGLNIPELLDTILLVADMNESRANTALPASGIVVEAHRDMRKGISAVVVIKEGTLLPNSCVVSEKAVCPVRAIERVEGGRLESATFSTPVRLSGWSDMPRVGATFTSCNSKRDALEKAAVCSIVPDMPVAPAKVGTHGGAQAGGQGMHGGQGAYNGGYTGAQAITPEGEPCTVIPFILKADAAGSLEALQYELAAVGTANVRLRTLFAGIGNISESDVKTASIEGGSVLVGFNVAIDPQAAIAAERMHIRIETFDIIYKLIEWLEAMVKERTPRIMVEQIAGTGKILKLFSKVKDKQIMGGRVLEGLIRNGEEVRIMRRGTELGKGKIRELQQQKQRVDEAKKDTEFGTMIESKVEIAPGDTIECVHMVEKSTLGGAAA